MEFFDFLYLGIFAILSTAFDERFYNGQPPPHHVSKESACAVAHFQSVLHIFSERYVVIIEDEAVDVLYVVNRMLAEFAAASVVLANAIRDSEDGEFEHGMRVAMLEGRIETNLLAFHPDVLPYYSRCLDCGHKDFLWTGPVLRIHHRAGAISSLISLTTEGEIVDLPSHQIYTEDVDAVPPAPPETVSEVGKRRGRVGSLGGDRAKKRIRRS